VWRWTGRTGLTGVFFAGGPGPSPHPTSVRHVGQVRSRQGVAEGAASTSEGPFLAARGLELSGTGRPSRWAGGAGHGRPESGGPGPAGGGATTVGPKTCSAGQGGRAGPSPGTMVPPRCILRPPPRDRWGNHPRATYMPRQRRASVGFDFARKRNRLQRGGRRGSTRTGWKGPAAMQQARQFPAGAGFVGGGPCDPAGQAQGRV